MASGRRRGKKQHGELEFLLMIIAAYLWDEEGSPCLLFSLDLALAAKSEEESSGEGDLKK